MAQTARTKLAGGDSKRLLIMLLCGAALLIGLVAFKVLGASGSPSSSSAPPVTAPATASAPAGAAGKAVAAAPAGPAPNTTRDPFHPLR